MTTPETSGAGAPEEATTVGDDLSNATQVFQSMTHVLVEKDGYERLVEAGRTNNELAWERMELSHFLDDFLRCPFDHPDHARLREYATLIVPASAQLSREWSSYDSEKLTDKLKIAHEVDADLRLHGWLPSSAPAQRWERTMATLRASVSQLEATVAEAHKRANRLAGLLMQDAESGDFGHGLDDRAALAVDLAADLATPERPERASSLTVPGSSQDVAVQALTPPPSGSVAP